MIVIAIAALLATNRPAAADQMYNVAGNDSYRIGTDLPSTNIVYLGLQRLSVVRSGKGTRYRAEAHYTRVDAAGKTDARASFVQELMASGSFQDRRDDDPDFLTILNQPFAIALDRTTLHDIRTMRGTIPFQASSPLGDSTLKGTLRPGIAGLIDGHPAIGVRFEAAGPMQGALPDHPDARISGSIRMDGTAYYSAKTALLLALDATLTIAGKLHSQASAVPIHIVYRRSIRADDSADAWTDAQR